MNRFRFSLESLLAKKHQLRERCLRAVTLVLREKKQNETQHSELAEKRDSKKLRELLLKSPQSRVIDAQHLTEVEAYRSQLQADIDELSRAHRVLSSSLVERKSQLKEIDREIEVLNTMKQKAYSEWIQKQRKREQSQLDELASLRRFQ